MTMIPNIDSKNGVNNIIHLHNDEVFYENKFFRQVECTICHRTLLKPKAAA